MRVLAVSTKFLASVLLALAASWRALGEKGERDTLSPRMVAYLFIIFCPTPFGDGAKFKLFANTLFLVEDAPGRKNRCCY